MDICALKYQWRDLIGHNWSVFRFNIGFKYISIDLFDEMIGFHFRMPWVWEWHWRVLIFSSSAVYGVETPFFEIVFVDRLGLIEG